MIAVELTKQLRRARGWVTLSTMAAIAIVLCVVIGITQASIAERIGDWGSVTTDTSGFTLPLIALNAMLLFLFPLGVAIFAGEPVAGEAAWGSLRYLLARPDTEVASAAVQGGRGRVVQRRRGGRRRARGVGRRRCGFRRAPPRGTRPPARDTEHVAYAGLVLRAPGF